MALLEKPKNQPSFIVFAFAFPKRRSHLKAAKRRPVFYLKAMKWRLCFLLFLPLTLLFLKGEAALKPQRGAYVLPKSHEMASYL